MKEDSIVNGIIAKFKQRSETGIAKYGTTLDRNDLSPEQWLNHLEEELMDAILYCHKLKTELNKIKNEKESKPKQTST
jgi:hypothetical protein